MAVTYKDINSLSQKTTLAGTEKLPVSDTQYITPYQITDKCAVANEASDYDCNELGTSFSAYKLNSAATHAFPGYQSGNLLSVGYPGSDTVFQLGASYSNHNLYFRSGTWSATGGNIRNESWHRIPFASEIPTAISELTNDSGFAKITISTSEPTSSDGENGDIWIVI